MKGRVVDSAMIRDLMKRIKWIGNISRVVAPNSPSGKEARWERFLHAVDKALENREYHLIEVHLEDARQWLETIPPEEAGLIEKTARLGDLFQELVGDNSKAEILYRQALALSESIEGPESLTTAGVLNTLSLFLIQQRRYEEAESMLERVLPIVEREFGPEHLEFATGLENLAAIYRQTDRPGEAAELRARAIKIRKAERKAGV